MGNTAMKTPLPDTRMLDEAVERIVEAVHPLKIILFGSAARGTTDQNSDLDFLIIMPDGVHRRQTTRHAYRAMFDFPMPQDIVVATESDIKLHGTNPSLVFAPALEEGLELYHA